MGFWKSVGKFTQSLTDAMDDDNSEVKEYAKMLRQYSDEQLVGMLQQSSKLAMSINERSAVQKVLRDRYPNSKRHNSIIKEHWDTDISSLSSANRWLRS